MATKEKPYSRFECLLIVLIVAMIIQGIVVTVLLSIAIAGGSTTTNLLRDMSLTTKELLSVSVSANQAMEAVASSEAREGLNKVTAFLAWVNEIERTHPQISISIRNIIDSMEDNANPQIGENVVNLFTALFSLNTTMSSLDAMTNMTYQLGQKFMSTNKLEISF